MRTEAVAEYERRLNDGMLNSNIEILDELLSDELIFTNHFGQLMTKTDDIEGHRSGFVKIESIETSEQKVKVLGDTAIVSVLSKIEGKFGGVQANALLRFTRIWKRMESNKWQVIATHSTAAPEAST